MYIKNGFLTFKWTPLHLSVNPIKFYCHNKSNSALLENIGISTVFLVIVLKFPKGEI